MNRILIVDDDVAVTNYLMVFLTQTERFESTVVNDSRQVAELLAGTSFDVMLLDMDMPHVTGMDILKRMRADGITTPVIILTGVGDVDLAVRSMKLGAVDYLTKPVEDEHLLDVIDAALELRAVHDAMEQLPPDLRREDLEHRDAFELIPTQNAEMIRLLHQAEKVAASDLGVFIWGERGTGKEMLARAVHFASPARGGPFVVVDASGHDPQRFPAAFFGQAALWDGTRQEQPGFLAQAENGTLYLCEIEHLTRPMQERLRRVLQTGEYYRENSTEIHKVRVRFIVSSSHDLTSDAFRETFSRDLLYHLMINSLSIPPLRERMEDLSLLVDSFRQKGLTKIPKTITGFSPEFLQLLAQHEFPDNLQELRNIIESAMVNSEGPVVGVDALPPYIRQKILSRKVGVQADFRPRTLAEVQREHVQRMLAYHGQDRERAARALGITPQELEALTRGVGGRGTG